MTVWPVIERELRAQSRHGFSHVIRLIGPAALLGVCIILGAASGFESQKGAYLFGWLHSTLLVAIWILAPVICADCISRERREGTVGLLFLTPLRAREIVLAKGFAHGIRALTLWLAALPVMTIPFLLGGVVWKEAALSVLVNFSSLCWALAAGLLASSVSKSWLRALLLAAGLAVCMATVFDILNGTCVLSTIGSDGAFQMPWPFFRWRWQSYAKTNYHQVALPAGFFGITDAGGWWGQMFGTLRHKSQLAWLMGEAGLAFFSLLVLLLAVLVASWNLRRVWQEEPPSARRLWLEDKLFTPVVAVNFFQGWIRRKLERNPIGWLEQRTWSGRLVTWGWLAVMISFYSAVFDSPNVEHLLAFVQNLMSWTLVGIIAASAAGSFQRERETRVLEILLVSPMSAGQIISGRLRGLWGQFLPALLLLLLMWGFLAETPYFDRVGFNSVPFVCGAYLTVPVIGLFYSLKRKHFIGAFLSTLWAGLALPFVLQWLLVLLAELLLGFGVTYFTGFAQSIYESGRLTTLYLSVREMVVWPLFINVIQMGIAIRFGRQLHEDLRLRNFAFSKTAG